MNHPNTPRCSFCGKKFCGDPCVACTGAPAQRQRDVDAAWSLRKTQSQRMPSATRRRRKHGR